MAWRSVFRVIGLVIVLIAVVATALTLLGVSPAASMALAMVSALLYVAMIFVWLARL